MAEECDNSIPGWLQSLLEESFFDPCGRHESAAKKNEKNVFCLVCRCGLCSHCLNRHPKSSHRLLQIRRYVYHDVIRLSDVQKLLDCSLVQPYTTNSAKVVFLKQRPVNRPFRCSGSSCLTCVRSLQDNYLFCSLYCKVQHIQKASKKPKIKMMTKKSLEDLIPQLRNVPSFAYRSTPESSDFGFSISANYLDRASAPTPTSNNKSRCLPPTDLAPRRKKGVPHRSPMY